MIAEHRDLGDVVLAVDRRAVVDAAFKEKGVAGFEAGFEVFCGVDPVFGDDEGFGEAIATGRKERGTGMGAVHVGEAVANLEANARNTGVPQVEVDAHVAVPSAVAGVAGGLGVFVCDLKVA